MVAVDKKLLIFGAILTALLLSRCSDHSSTQSSTALANGSEATTPPPEFTFRKLIPGKTTLKEAKKSHAIQYCSEYSSGGASCMFSSFEVAGVPAGAGSAVFDDKGVFDWMLFKPDPDSYDALLTAVSNVYGPPCATDSRVLQNAFGAQFHGDEASWCFSQGTLTLRRHNKDKVTEGEFQFFQTPPAAASAPTSYSPDTL